MDIKNKFLILIVINVITYFAANWIANQSGSNIYILMGVQRNLVLDYHEYYRIITYAFAHADVMHLFVNMLALYSLSDPVIRFTDEKFSFIIYLIAIVVSGVGVIIFDANAIMVGSSGAIYGLFGILIYFAIEQALKGNTVMFRSLFPVIVINVIISLMPGISLLGHLFGLLTGLVGAFIYSKVLKKSNW